MLKNPDTLLTNELTLDELDELMSNAMYINDELEFKSDNAKKVFIKALNSTNVTYIFRCVIYDFMEAVSTLATLKETEIKLIYKGYGSKDEAYTIIKNEIHKKENIVQSKLNIMLELALCLKANNMSSDGFDKRQQYKFQYIKSEFTLNN